MVYKLNQCGLSTYLPACRSILHWFIFLNGQIIFLYFMDKKIMFIETVLFINRENRDSLYAIDVIHYNQPNILTHCA